MALVPVSKDNAVLLLDAAQSLDLPPEVVKSTMYGFDAPDEVVEKAGLGKKKPAKKAAKKSAASNEE